VVIRIVRIVVPWILLLAVGAVLWSLVEDYRAATDAAESGGSAETTAQAEIATTEPYVVVLSDGLNLRAEASTTSAVVQVLAVDQRLALVEEGLGWYRVRTAEGVEGWVAAGGRYTQLVKP
jgi:SH3-like domain-containing protein